MKTIKQRFDEKIDKSGNCWQWTGWKNRVGYGSFWYKDSPKRANRVAWLLEYGEIPNGMCVCHHCDNPSCVNPDHLFLGTHLDNMKDAALKGRFNPKIGQENGNSKLTEQQVLEIREMQGSLSQKNIARLYGVTQPLVGNIHRREIWRHI